MQAQGEEANTEKSLSQLADSNTEHLCCGANTTVQLKKQKKLHFTKISWWMWLVAT